MRIGLGQIDSVLGDVDGNIQTMLRFIEQARAQQVDLLVFPELSVTGYWLGHVEEDLSLGLDDPRLQSLITAAGDMAVVFGFHEDAGLRTFNSAAFVQSGSVVHVHRKLYLPNYGPFEERKWFSPGQTMRGFRTGLGTMATLICNDAWQPVLPFLAVQDGAEVLIVPTNSSEKPTSDGVDNSAYWHDITRFYARIYQTFVIFVNRVGHESNLSYWGQSHVMDPSAQMLVQASSFEQELVVVDIDLKEITRWRRRAPLVREARLAMLERELARLASSGGDL